MKDFKKEFKKLQRERNKRLIGIKIKRFAHKNDLPDPFPITPVEKRKYEVQKQDEIANNPDLGNWVGFLREYDWTHQCVNRDDLIRIIKNKPDKRTWVKKEWTAYFMSNVLIKMIEEQSEKELTEV